MTNEEAIAELARQIELFPRVVLPFKIFEMLKGMAQDSDTGIHAATWHESEQESLSTLTYDYQHGIGTVILDMRSARLLHHGAVAYVAAQVTHKLSGAPK